MARSATFEDEPVVDEARHGILRRRRLILTPTRLVAVQQWWGSPAQFFSVELAGLRPPYVEATTHRWAALAGRLLGVVAVAGIAFLLLGRWFPGWITFAILLFLLALSIASQRLVKHGRRAYLLIGDGQFSMRFPVHGFKPDPLRRIAASAVVESEKAREAGGRRRPTFKRYG